MKIDRHIPLAAVVVHVVNGLAGVEAVAPTEPGLEAVFRAHYQRVVHIVARVVKNRTRAEELAVEVFLRWARNPPPRADSLESWFYRTAVCAALDELRREKRRSRYEQWLGLFSSRTVPTPEELHSQSEEAQRVRSVLGTLRASQAQLLILRSDGLSYNELAEALGIRETSVGTTLARAQTAFRKEYIKRYGNK